MLSREIASFTPEGPSSEIRRFEMTLIVSGHRWPRNKAVAAIKESSHVMVRFFAFKIRQQSPSSEPAQPR